MHEASETRTHVHAHAPQAICFCSAAPERPYGTQHCLYLKSRWNAIPRSLILLALMCFSLCSDNNRLVEIR